MRSSSSLRLLIAVLAAVAAVACVPAAASADVGVSIFQTTPGQPVTGRSLTFMPMTFLLRDNPGATATWDFGDGSAPVAGAPSTGLADHVFSTAGTYTLGLVIAAPGGAVLGTGTRVVTVDAPPPTLVLHLGTVSAGSVARLQSAGIFTLDCIEEAGAPCHVTARVDDVARGRLGLATDVVATGVSPASGASTIDVTLTPEAFAALGHSTQDVVLQIEASATRASSGQTATRTTAATLRGLDLVMDCALFTPGMWCPPAGTFPGVIFLHGPGATPETPDETPDTPDETPEERVETPADTPEAQPEAPGTPPSITVIPLPEAPGTPITPPGAKPPAARRLVGTARADRIVARAGVNVIVAGRGDDRIDARRGSGTIDCGAGKDTVVLVKQKPVKQTKAEKRAKKQPRRAPDAYRLKGCEKVTRG